MMLRSIAVPIAVFILFPMVALAQPLPATPDPSECVVEPRPVSFFEPLVAELLAATPTAGTVVAPAAEPAGAEATGEPADAETEAEVVALLREAIACVNAGDFPRLAALLTDAAARDAVLVGWGVGIRAVCEARVRSGGGALSDREILDVVVGPSSPLGEGPSGALVAVRDVRELPDGRVVATAVRTLADGSELETRIVLEREDGRLRLAEETPLAIQGTPIP